MGLRHKTGFSAARLFKILTLVIRYNNFTGLDFLPSGRGGSFLFNPSTGGAP
jgi:hypothetical protein